jgi:hypothetical protein
MRTILLLCFLAITQYGMAQSDFEKKYVDSISIPRQFSLKDKVLIVMIPMHWKKWEAKIAEIMQSFKGTYELHKGKTDQLENMKELDKKYPDTTKYRWVLSFEIIKGNLDLFHEANISLVDRSFHTPYGNGRPYPPIAKGRNKFESFFEFAVLKLNNRLP